jgi:hypothetical protein
MDMSGQARPGDPDSAAHSEPWWARIISWLRGFVFGMTYYEMSLTLRKERADREYLFVLISFGDLLGVPILPPYYSIRLLPYVYPLLDGWKRQMLRERDLTDLADSLG